MKKSSLQCLEGLVDQLLCFVILKFLRRSQKSHENFSREENFLKMSIFLLKLPTLEKIIKVFLHNIVYLFSSSIS